jgi:hypothetical protein
MEREEPQVLFSARLHFEEGRLRVRKISVRYTVLQISQLKAIGHWPPMRITLYMCIMLTLVDTLIAFVLHGPCKVPFE